MKGNRIQKYLAYAIGEIVLVVIGILIAVSINNWNEREKSKDNLVDILEIYKKDLAKDTITMNARAFELEEKKKLFQIFMSDTVEIADYGRHPGGLALAVSNNPIELQRKGLTLLENYSATNETYSQLAELVSRHNYLETLINNTQKLIDKDIDDNLTYYKNNEPWVADFLNNKFTNPDLHAYLLSANHKSRLAIHKSLLINNLSGFIQLYNNYATNTIQEIDALIAAH